MTSNLGTPPPRPVVIDLHSHVLPGIDDGPDELEGSLALARAAARDGTRVLVATPHARHDHPDVRVDEIAARCEHLQQRLPADVELRIVPGAEVDLAWGQAASDEELRLASLGQRGKYLLVETPYGVLPLNFEDMLFNLTLRGFRLLLAHPERNPSLQRDPNRLEALVRRGVLVQVTAASITLASRRSPSRRAALTLMRRALVHVIASDAHSPGELGRGGVSAAARVAARIDPRRANWMVEDAPRTVLAGEELPPHPDEASAAGRPPRLLRRRRWRR